MHNILLHPFFISSNCCVNERDEVFRRTPLNYAAYYNNPEVVRLLLKNGADVELQDRLGDQPIHSAASRGNNEYVDVPKNILWTRFCYNYHYTNLTFVGNLHFKTRS